MRSRLVLAAAAASALLLAAPPSSAVDTDIRYPAKVTTMDGRIFELDDFDHALSRGSFVLYDGETEGRVPWRDLDEIVFVENIGHGPGAIGPKRAGTERVRMRYVDGHERIVNLVIGKVRGYDGRAEREIPVRKLSRIDFDEVRIAPSLYKACERGHVWEQEDYRYCPYDGKELSSYRVDSMRR